MAGIARDEGEAVGRRRAADEYVEFALQPADTLQVRLLHGIGFQGAFKRQDAATKELL